MQRQWIAIWHCHSVQFVRHTGSRGQSPGFIQNTRSSGLRRKRATLRNSPWRFVYVLPRNSSMPDLKLYCPGPNSLLGCEHIGKAQLYTRNEASGEATSIRALRGGRF